MNFPRSVVAFVQEHNRFLVRYVIHMCGAVVCVLVGLTFAIYGRPVEQTVAAEVSVAKQVLPMNTVADLNEEQSANLSPAQWKQMEDLLRVLPTAVPNIKNLQYHAWNRHNLVVGFGEYVFSHLDSLPGRTREDWQSLQRMKLWNDYDTPLHYSREVQYQQLFLSKTLSIAEVRKILEMRAEYEESCQQINDSSNLIDRVLPVLLENGLPNPDIYHDPYKSLAEYIAHHDYEKKATLPAGKLPPLELTVEQMVNQMTESALSSGATSADRTRAARAP